MKRMVSLVLSVLLLLSMSSFALAANVTMYAADGRTISVASKDVEAYKAVGWYTEPVVLMYAQDGRTLYVEKSRVEAHKAVGWFDQPLTPVYAPDGRTLYVLSKDVEAYKAVGWSAEPFVTVYAADGRTLAVKQSDVEAYKAVGWFTTVTMYAPDGRTREVNYPDVQSWINVGWYTAPVTTVYAADGRSMIVYTSDLQLHRASGWYSSKQEAIAADPSSAEIVQILKDCERYVNLASIAGSVLKKNIDLYHMSGKSSYLVNAIKEVDRIDGYFAEIRKKTASCRMLYPFYLDADRTRPIVTSSSTASAYTYGTYAERIQTTYDYYCKRYGLK